MVSAMGEINLLGNLSKHYFVPHFWTAFLIFYLPLSLLPTFYPSVAEGKGAKPSQVRFFQAFFVHGKQNK